MKETPKPVPKGKINAFEVEKDSPSIKPETFRKRKLFYIGVIVIAVVSIIAVWTLFLVSGGHSQLQESVEEQLEKMQITDLERQEYERFR